ncbi:MAG: hypothetical protein IPI26_02285 [Elusimicrobia bacterium]|nr:hypothetical protein [Elusimicrobiota bacterium]
MNRNDLWDQDDDNDGNIDVQCRYYIDAKPKFGSGFQLPGIRDGATTLKFCWIQFPVPFSNILDPSTKFRPSADNNRDNIVTWQEIDQNPRPATATE